MITSDSTLGASFEATMLEAFSTICMGPWGISELQILLWGHCGPCPFVKRVLPQRRVKTKEELWLNPRHHHTTVTHVTITPRHHNLSDISITHVIVTHATIVPRHATIRPYKEDTNSQHQR
jgi:hypothetical protein